MEAVGDRMRRPKWGWIDDTLRKDEKCIAKGLEKHGEELLLVSRRSAVNQTRWKTGVIDSLYPPWGRG